MRLIFLKGRAVAVFAALFIAAIPAAGYYHFLHYLDGPAGRRVRTNNHVERANRLFRFLEKVRSRWRRRRTPVRFVVLKLDEVWSHWTPPRSAELKPEEPNRGREARPGAGQRSLRAA